MTNEQPKEDDRKSLVSVHSIVSDRTIKSDRADSTASVKSAASAKSVASAKSAGSGRKSVASIKEETEDPGKAENGDVLSVKDDNKDDDDTSSEILRAEQAAEEEEKKKKTNLGRLLKTVRLVRQWVTGKKEEEEKSADRPDSFLERFAMSNQNAQGQTGLKITDPSFILKWTLDPASNTYYRWLGVISFAVLYNLLLIVARSVFWKLQNYYRTTWFVLDYLCDVIYMMDIFVQFRTAYFDQGLLVRDTAKLRRRHLKSTAVKLDALSILPTDLLYLVSGHLDIPYVRFNRLFKFYRMIAFFNRTDTKTNYPNLFRIFVLVLYILVIIHWNACLYFQMSAWIGFGSDGWVYFNISEEFPANNSLSRQYVYSFYWSTLTLTTIGETPRPETDVEFVFVVIDFLIGVLIFATIVGNVGNMITNMNAARADFQRKMDGVKLYMKLRRVQPDIERRVIKWFDYMWNNRQSLDEEEIFCKLPDKLKAEIAIHVHLDTLKRIKLFKDCEPGLLVQLVLKLRLSVFSPGDYVCRKGDIGREMYIVKRGFLRVVTEDGRTPLATLSEGSVFGEVSLLNIAGNMTGNRRTANVRSIGYSDLFILSKDDLWSVLTEYPEAKTKLIERGKELLLKDDLLDERAALEAEMKLITTEAKLTNMQSNLEALTNRFARLAAEYSSSQQRLKQRLTTLEKKYRVSRHPLPYISNTTYHF